MKTLILSLILIIGLSAPNHGKPINDIYSIEEPVFTEEAYVNDIPFDTWEIAVEAIFEGDEAKLPEEPYVNDIPFDTRTIACKYLLRKMLETRGEANVNDIPFDTEKVLCERLAEILTEQYRNEKNISDPLPKIDQVILTYDNGAKSSYTVIYTGKQETSEEKPDHDAVNPGQTIVPKASL
jgi:hypothetical protein